MKPLRKRLVGQDFGSTGKGKSKAPLLNLDAPNGSPPDPETSPPQAAGSGLDGLTAEQQICHDVLFKSLKSCENCPHTHGSFCVKTKDNSHVQFTARQVKSWAKAWVWSP